MVKVWRPLQRTQHLEAHLFLDAGAAGVGSGEGGRGTGSDAGSSSDLNTAWRRGLGERHLLQHQATHVRVLAGVLNVYADDAALIVKVQHHASGN